MQPGLGTNLPFSGPWPLVTLFTFYGPDFDILIGFSGISLENILLANQFLEPAHTQFHVSDMTPTLS